MPEVDLFLDANVLAAPVTRTLVLAGALADGLTTVWSAQAEAEADAHASPRAKRVSVVRRETLGLLLSPTASTTTGLVTASPKDRQIIADAIAAGVRYLITVDVDDFALEDLQTHRMSAVNPDYFMALRYSEHAYREGIRVLAEVARRPPRTEADVHAALGRRHPRLTTRFVDAYSSSPVVADPDQPGVVFRGAICIRCERGLLDADQQRIGLCSEHIR